MCIPLSVVEIEVDWNGQTLKGEIHFSLSPYERWDSGRVCLTNFLPICWLPGFHTPYFARARRTPYVWNGRLTERALETGREGLVEIAESLTRLTSVIELATHEWDRIQKLEAPQHFAGRITPEEFRHERRRLRSLRRSGEIGQRAQQQQLKDLNRRTHSDEEVTYWIAVRVSEELKARGAGEILPPITHEVLASRYLHLAP